MNIKDIAKKAGVSTATVSRALNNPEKVKKDTLEKVMQVVDDNRYSLNPFARSLASSGRTNNVVLVVPNSVNPFFSQLASGAESLFDEYGYYMHVYNIGRHLRDPGRVTEILEEVANEGFFDGLILSGISYPGENSPLRMAVLNKPVVLIEPNPDSRMDCVLVDERTGIWLAFEHLKKKGYTRLGLIHGGKNLDLTTRKMHYIRELQEEFSLETRPEWTLETSYDSVGLTYNLMNRYLTGGPELPDVFFAFNDLLAITAARALLDHGHRIPQDVALLGSDDIQLARYFNPALTTIKTPTEDLGKTAARILLNKMTNPTLPPQRIFLPPTLIVRESC